MPQLTFNPEALNAQFEQVQKNVGFEATIREITERIASDVFGADCENPDRPVIVLRVEVTDGEYFNETYTLPKSAGSWKRENFKLGQFARKYGSVPYTGQKIQVVVNSEGYYRIAL
jgi:hypothetical protein